MDAIERLHETSRSSWDLAAHAGASRWEIFAKASAVEEVHFGDSPPVLRTMSAETGVAVRLRAPEGAGFGAASGSGPDAARAALLGARNSLFPMEIDPLPPPHLLGFREMPAPRPLPTRGWARDTATRLSEAILAESASRLRIRGLNFHRAEYGWLLSTGEGFTASHEDTMLSLTAQLDSRGSQHWRHEEWFWIPDTESFDCEKAAVRIAGRCDLYDLPLSSREGLYDLLFHPEMSAHLAAALAPLFLPGPIDRLAPLLDRHGRLAAPCLRLVEDPSAADCPARTPCDGEGMSSRSHLLLERGIPRHRPSSYFESRLYGDPPQGGALRMSYRDRPHAGTSSIYLHSERPASPKDLIPSRGFALYLTRPLAPITLEPEEDSFRLLASGIWLEEGRPKYSQPLVEIRSSLSHLLRRIEAVGSDLNWYQTPAGFVAAPSMLIHCQRIMG